MFYRKYSISFIAINILKPTFTIINGIKRRKYVYDIINEYLQDENELNYFIYFHSNLVSVGLVQTLVKTSK